MEFSRENIENICESTKAGVASMASVIDIIAASTGNPQIKGQMIASIANGVIDAIKPIASAFADAQNGKDLAGDITTLIEQLAALKSIPDLPEK